MAWLGLNELGEECIFGDKPSIDRDPRAWKGYWGDFYIDRIKLPRGSIKKLIGRDLNCDNELVEIKLKHEHIKS